MATHATASVPGVPAARRWFPGRSPAGRFGRPVDVAGALAHLGSEDPSRVTGTHLVVDGGRIAGLDLPDPAAPQHTPSTGGPP